MARPIKRLLCCTAMLLAALALGAPLASAAESNDIVAIEPHLQERAEQQSKLMPNTS